MNLNPLIHSLKNKLLNYFSKDLQVQKKLFNLASSFKELEKADLQAYEEAKRELRYERFGKEKDEKLNALYSKFLEDKREDIILKMICYWMVQASLEGIDTRLITDIERKHGRS